MKTTAQTGTEAETNGTNGYESEAYPFGPPARPKTTSPAAAEVATEARLKKWAPRRYALDALPQGQKWARDLLWKFQQDNAKRDHTKFGPTLFVKGDQAVSAGATDAQLQALRALTESELAELQVRSAAEVMARQQQVKALAADIAANPDGDTDDGPLYADIAQLLSGGLPDPPTPDILRRSDGVGLFYRGEINLLYGDPEDGKTMIALAACAQVLGDGGTALFIDLDDNGVASTVARLLMLGAPKEALCAGRFRYCSPAGRDRLAEAIRDSTAQGRAPDVAVIDCVGELVPLFDGSNNDSDDFTRIIRTTAAPLSRAGAAVILIDHMAKNSDSRRYGAGGTMAKRRRVGGTQLRVIVEVPLRKGQGGSLRLQIRKDRHSGLRQHCPPAPDNEGALQQCGTFLIDPGDTAWCITADPMVMSAASATRNDKHRAYIDAAGLLDDGWTIPTLAKRVHGEEVTETQRKATARSVDALIESGQVERLTEGAKFAPATHRLVR